MARHPATSCDARGFGGARCRLSPGHRGLHAGELRWETTDGPAPAPAGDDDTPTVSFPPIRETVRRRPPVPEVRDLQERAELIEAMGRELQRELRELRDDPAAAPAACGAVHATNDGVEWECGRERGHEGTHEVHGRRWL